MTPTWFSWLGQVLPHSDKDQYEDYANDQFCLSGPHFKNNENAHQVV